MFLKIVYGIKKCWILDLGNIDKILIRFIVL